MPWAAIGAIAALAGSAFSVGDTLYQQANAPGQSSSAQQQPTQAQAVSAETANRQQVVSQAALQLPGLQYEGGGGLSPGYLATQSSTDSGNSQYGSSPQIQQLVNSFLGLGGVGTGSSAGPVSSLLPGLTAPSVNSGVSSATNSFLNPQAQAQGAFATSAGSIF